MILQNKVLNELMRQTYNLKNNGPFLPYSRPILRGTRNSSEHPWDITHHIRDHEHVMRVVIVAGCDIHPPTAGECAYDPEHEHDCGENGITRALEVVLESYKGEPRACSMR
jgi:hypothetical protein